MPKNAYRKRYFDRVKKSSNDVKSALFYARYPDVCGFCSLEIQVDDRVGYVSGELRCEDCYRTAGV